MITLRVMPSPIILDLLQNYMERCIGQTALLFGSSPLRKPGIAFTAGRRVGAGCRQQDAHQPTHSHAQHGSDGDRVLFYSGMAQSWNEGAQCVLLGVLLVLTGGCLKLSIQASCCI